AGAEIGHPARSLGRKPGAARAARGDHRAWRILAMQYPGAPGGVSVATLPYPRYNVPGEFGLAPSIGRLLAAGFWPGADRAAALTAPCASDNETKPWVPAAAATLVPSATPSTCIGITLTCPFASHTSVAADAPSTGAAGHGPREGHAPSAASTV